ncbi:redoxin domain-containing protein [Celeribacter sp.]|uniref:redoxin domain-containing protein n=1 Tax=Celeribacter sp. TaxID=1890673 RepID=UPI003A9037F5
MPTPKPVPEEILGPIEVPKLGGGVLTLGGPRERWSLIVVYRGKHCPRCKKYLNVLNEMRDQWDAAGFDVAVVSADSAAKAQEDVDAFGWGFDLGYGLTEAQMAQLGVYVTAPLSPSEADGNFAEPGVFVLRPDGSLIVVAISNGPAARPDLAELFDGMVFNKTNDRPTRGLV